MDQLFKRIITCGIAIILYQSFAIGQVEEMLFYIYSSPNPKTDLGVTEDDLWEISFYDAFTINVDLSGGINANGDFSTINLQGTQYQPQITLSMYAYDNKKVDGKGRIIYQAQATHAGNLVAEPTFSRSYTELRNLEAGYQYGAYNVMSLSDYNSLNIKMLGMKAKFQVPNIGNMPTLCSQEVEDEVNNANNKESLLDKFIRWSFSKSHHHPKGSTTALSVATPGDDIKKRSIALNQECRNWIDNNVYKNKIIVTVKVKFQNQVDFSSVKVPLLGVKNKSDFTSKVSHLGKAISGLRKPDYDKMIVAAHRGYFKDVPENSSAAIMKAIEQDVEIVEIDIRLTKDKKIVLAHDLQLGRLTTIPDRIRNNPPQGGWPKLPGSNEDKILISDLTLKEVRPDLFGNYSAEPIYLKNADGSVTTEMIPTLEETLRQCKGTVIVDIDKIENYYDLVYQVAEKTGTLHQVIVKGRFGTPQDLKDNCCSKGVNNLDEEGNPIIDWSKFMFTPIYFSDAQPKDENGNSITISQSIDSFIVADASTFNCVGVELIYRTNDDVLISEIQKIKDKNKHVIQFPQYPENSGGVWNPKKFRFNDIDLRHDHRNDWEWVLDPSHRPSLLITDRLEVLLNLLEMKGLRD